MKKATKIIALLLCAVLLVGASVAGTLAYLTSQDSVKNTFTVGNVKITLDEAPVDTDGQAIAGARVKKNTYHLLPGHEYDKDPTVHVDTKSDDCYVFVEVTNEITAIEDPNATIKAWMLANGWTLVTGETAVYYYSGTGETANAAGKICKAGDNLVVFEGFKIADNVSGDTLKTYAPVIDAENEENSVYKTIAVTAYAVQEDGFTGANDAWSKSFGAENNA